MAVVAPPAMAGEAHDLAARLTDAGFSVRVAADDPPAPPEALPARLADEAKSCIADGHADAFKLDYAAARERFSGCEVRMGPALSRDGDGRALLSTLLAEEADALLASGDRPSARAVLERLARLAGAASPDPVRHPPDLIALWNEARASADAGARPASLSVTPVWAQVWIDGREVGVADPPSLAPGAHFVFAIAAGFGAAGSTPAISAEAPARISIAVGVPIDAGRRAAIRAAATAIPLAAPGAVEAISDAFGRPVVLLSAPSSASLLLPAEPAASMPARLAGRWTGDVDVLAHTVAEQLHPRAARRSPGPWPFVIGGGVVVGVGVGLGLLLQKPGGGPKHGSVVWGG